MSKQLRLKGLPLEDVIKLNQRFNEIESKADSSSSSVIIQSKTYIHPETHPATMIVQDSTHRFVTDNEKSIWNANAPSQSGKYYEPLITDLGEFLFMDGDICMGEVV